MSESAKHILVVDDERMILDMLSKMLERFGYRVTVYDKGSNALEYFQEHHGDVDLVVLDMMMPDMTGQEICEAMVAIDPDVTVLVSSGYDPNPENMNGFGSAVCGFLKKPYRLDELKQSISTAMASSGQP